MCWRACLLSSSLSVVIQPHYRPSLLDCYAALWAQALLHHDQPARFNQPADLGDTRSSAVNRLKICTSPVSFWFINIHPLRLCGNRKVISICVSPWFLPSPEICFQVDTTGHVLHEAIVHTLKSVVETEHFSRALVLDLLEFCLSFRSCLGFRCPGFRIRLELS